MAEKKLKVYCETSFWSFLNGRPTSVQHVAVKQFATLKGYESPVIITPMDFLDRKEEFGL